MELIEIKGSGLTCDNKNCDYVDKTVLHTNLASFINKPCPECNENLLTLEDYQLNVKALEVINSINQNYSDRDNSSDTKELDKYINASISCHENIKIVFGDKNV